MIVFNPPQYVGIFCQAMKPFPLTTEKAAFLINKTLKAAVADAENNFDLDADRLVVKEASVTSGPSFRRFKPRARGSASAIKKRTCHIMVTVEEGDVPESSKGRVKSKKKTTPQTATTNNVTEEVAPVEFTATETPAEETTAIAAGTTTVDEKRGIIYSSAPTDVDDLKKISGVGPVLETKLNEFGIYTYAQVSDWTPENITEFDNLLSFKGRIERDNWLEQAKELHEEKYGN